MHVGELARFWRDQPRDHRVAFGVIAAVGLILRLDSLSQPMRYDEAVTYLEFVRLPLGEALSNYRYPNNHLFHTLLVKAAVGLFGSAPWVLRLPALLAGLAIIPLSYAVARSLFSARAALVAASLVASSGVLTLYSTNARGYTMVVAAFLILVLLAARILDAPSRGLWIGFAVVAALGLWTIPVMLYPLGAVSLWLLLNLLAAGRRRDVITLAAVLGAGALLTLLAYAPVLLSDGFSRLARNKFIAASEWTQFLNDMAASGWGTLKSWSLGVPPFVSSVFLAAAVIALDRQRGLSRFTVGLPLAAFVWSAWLLVVTHRAPYPRIWLWCIPVVASLAGAGLVDVIDRSRRLSAFVARVPMVAAAIVIVVGSSVALSRAVRGSLDTGTFVDAEATAEQLAPMLREGDRVIAAIPTNGPLAYYFARLGVSSTYLQLDEALASRLIVVVNEGERETLDAVVEGLAPNDSSEYTMAQIASRPRSKVFVLERRNAP